MKVGLVLAHKGVNYGMLLQAYATQRMVEKLGYETEVIDYERTNFKHIRWTPWLLFFFFFEMKRKKRLRERNEMRLDEIHEENVKARKSVSKDFIERRFTNRKKVRGIEQLEALGQTYSGVIVGSDQIWPPDAAFGNFNTLRFVPDHVNKISYATSLGVSEYPFWCKSSADNFLQRFNHISVREEQGKKVINEFSDVDVKVVADPTYLLTKEEWKKLIPEERIVDGKYVLCYFLGNNREHKLLARAYADKHGLPLVSILSTESVSDIDLSFADKVITGKGPEDFINLIRNAEVVMTDSFHGLAFSVINNVQFYVFYRTKVGSKGSRNSRIENILKMWDIQNRLVLNDASVEDFSSTPIDYDKVNRLIEAKRQYSIDFLSNALKDCK